MIGPKPKGFYTARLKEYQYAWEYLAAGKRYQVVREFSDADQSVHPVGEAWTFLGYNYQAMDEGYLFFVSTDGQQEWHIPMQRQEQAAVIENPMNYLQPIGDR